MSWSSSLNTKVARMEMRSSSASKLQLSFFTLATMVALLSQSLVVPVMSIPSDPFHYRKTYNSHHPNTRTPSGGHHATTPGINCDNPPHGGGGGHHHDPSTPSSKSPPSSGHHVGGGGYYHSPPTYTPTPTTPTTPIATPPVDPGTPTTPTLPTPSPPYSPHPNTPPYYSPPSGTPPYYTPPSGTPPFPFDPNTPPSGTPPIYTPPSGTPPFPFDPNSPPFPCTFWKTHPTLIWGLVGWNGNTIRTIFGLNNNIRGFGTSLNLLEALSNTRTDGYGELYREGTAAMLNSMISKNFPYTTQQVRDSFGRAALSSNQAAAAQAKLFKSANEGHLKPRS